MVVRKTLKKVVCGRSDGLQISGFLRPFSCSGSTRVDASLAYTRWLSDHSSESAMTRPSTPHSSGSVGVRSVRCMHRADASRQYESSSSSTICTPTSASGSGARKIHFNPHSDWDFIAATDSEPVDLDLLLPHYRAVNQPLTHRLSMYVHSRHGEVKTKVVRQLSR